MLTENNQIFKNWYVIIHRHLTKVSAQIIQCIIFEHNELSITLSTLWCHRCMKRKTLETNRFLVLTKSFFTIEVLQSIGYY